MGYWRVFLLEPISTVTPIYGCNVCVLPNYLLVVVGMIVCGERWTSSRTKEANGNLAWQLCSMVTVVKGGVVIWSLIGARMRCCDCEKLVSKFLEPTMQIAILKWFLWLLWCGLYARKTNAAIAQYCQGIVVLTANVNGAANFWIDFLWWLIGWLNFYEKGYLRAVVPSADQTRKTEQPVNLLMLYSKMPVVILNKRVFETWQEANFCQR